jgi:hypothetical protein
MMLAFERLFLLFGWALALALPLLFFMRQGPAVPGSRAES